MTAKVPISETGTSIIGRIIALQSCRNTSTTMATRMTASTQRVEDLVDRFVDERRRVVDDLVIDAGWEMLLELLHAGATGPWPRPARCCRAVERRRGRRTVARRGSCGCRSSCAELDPADVAQARDLAIGAGLDDDVAELVWVDESAEGHHGVLKIEPVR